MQKEGSYAKISIYDPISFYVCFWHIINIQGDNEVMDSGFYLAFSIWQPKGFHLLGQCFLGQIQIFQFRQPQVGWVREEARYTRPLTQPASARAVKKHSGFSYIHRIVQISPLSNSRTLLSPQKKARTHWWSFPLPHCLLYFLFLWIRPFWTLLINRII